MHRGLLVHGVPERIRLDAWWLGADADTGAGSVRGGSDHQSGQADWRKRQGLAVLALLVLMADWLFWHHSPGISIALFALILSAAMLAFKPGGANRRAWAVVLGIELLCNLPLVEQLQTISLLFSLSGVIGLAIWMTYGRLVSGGRAILVFLRLSTVGATLLARTGTENIDRSRLGSGLRRQASALLLPLLAGGVFLLLLSAANPILQDVLEAMDPQALLDPDIGWRVAFWCAAASFLWPYLNLDARWLGSLPHAPAPPRTGPGRAAFLINPASVRTSLFLFNLLFLVQTEMDIGILTGGVTLPEGMSYATYAHRGAYPLVVTALLAGAFAVATSHLIGADRRLRALLFLWLGQNMFLVVTAAFRLSLYVDVYALTYLRVAAFIWMGLVLTGLVLIVIQMVRNHSNAWLMRMNFYTLSVTLYLCCFVNFAQVIAGYNLHHSAAPTRLDISYVCNLGPQALPEIHRYERKAKRKICRTTDDAEQQIMTPRNWREWGFRNWRLQAYLHDQYLQSSVP